MAPAKVTNSFIFMVDYIGRGMNSGCMAVGLGKAIGFFRLCWYMRWKLRNYVFLTTVSSRKYFGELESTVN